MAVAEMRRLELFGLRRDLPVVLDILQRSEAVEIAANEEAAGALYDSQAMAALEREIAELERLLGFFDRVAPRRPNLIEQFAGIKTVLTEERFLAYATDAAAVRRVSDEAGILETELAAQTAQLHEQRTLRGHLEPWRALDLTRAELEGTPHVRLILGEIPLEQLNQLREDLCPIEPRAVAIMVGEDREDARVVVLWPRETEADPVLAYPGFNQIMLPEFTGRIGEALDALASGIRENEERTVALTENAVRLAEARPRVAARLDYLRGEAAKMQALRHMAETRYAFRLQGWIPSARIEHVRRELDRSRLPFALTSRPPEPGEDVPAIMKNAGPVEPFEALIQGFSYPKYGEIDPTSVTAPFFFLFFGFCLGDAAYGVILALLCLVLLKRLKMTPVGRKLTRVFIYGGLGAILMGLITGSIFGDLLGFTSLLDPIGRSEHSMALLGIALALGVIQLFLGTVLSALPSLRAGQWRDALFNQGVWLLFLASIMLLLAKGFADLELGPAVNYVAVAATVLLFYSATRGRKGIVGKLLGIPIGLYNIYGSMGFFSDILSYSRLMVLGLSSGIMAVIVNMFVRLIAAVHPFLIPVAVLVGIGGHLVNFALAILGAYIHSSRLQFLEFYGKFFAGGGRPFRPLRREQKHILVVNREEA